MVALGRAGEAFVAVLVGAGLRTRRQERRAEMRSLNVFSSMVPVRFSELTLMSASGMAGQ